MEAYDRVTIGRDPRATISLADDAVARRYAAIEWCEEPMGWAWEPEGEPRRLLVEGEVVTITPELQLRFSGSGALPFREPALEAQLVEHWDDAVADVYADWLLERGEPLGTWMRDRTPERFARSLDVAARQLEFEWRHGFVHSLSVMDRSPGVLVTLRDCLTHPLCRFLEEISVEWSAVKPEGPERRWANRSAALQGLEALALHVPRSVKKLVLSGFEPGPHLENVARRLRERATKLELEVS